MTRRMLTPAGPLDLADDAWNVSSTVATPATALGAMTVLVSPVLPVEPSPGEVARRIVRHGYAAAREETGRMSYFPDSLGDVGPKPGDKIRAIEAHGQLYVDAALGEDLKREGARARERAWQDTRRIMRERIDLGVIAGMIGVPRVEALREPDYCRTLYRAHLKPSGELERTVWTGGPQVRITDDELRAGDPWRRRAYIAGKLRAAIVEWKLDDEEAGRGR